MSKQESDYLEAEGEYMICQLELDQCLERFQKPYKWKFQWSEDWPLVVFLFMVVTVTPLMFGLMAHVFVTR